MLDSAPIGTHADNFFGNPHFGVPAEARRKHMTLFGGTGTASFAIFSNCATVISFRVSGTDAARIRDEFGLTIPASSLQELPDYKMYVRTLTREQGKASSPSGPHYVAGYPPVRPSSPSRVP